MQMTQHSLHIAVSIVALVFGMALFAAPPALSTHELSVYKHGAVAADHVVASKAGAEILRQGGNAVDAAVATSFCLSVVRPYSCGIGGGGFMVIYDPRADQGKPFITAIDYRENAPPAASPEMFADDESGLASRYGGKSVAVPGTVAGLLHALEKYGTLEREVVLAPAIRAAQRGFVVDEDHVKAAQHIKNLRDAQPHLRLLSAFVWEFFCFNGDVKVGDIIRNPAQAKVLRHIADRGLRAFTQGEVRDAITTAVLDAGGSMSGDALADYEVGETKPLAGSFQGFDVFCMPPPSSGGVTMLQVLGQFERAQVQRAQSPNDVTYLHTLAESMKHAFADRASWLADPAYVDLPIDRLLSESYLDQLADRIFVHDTGVWMNYGSHAESDMAMSNDGGTSHISVIDENGMAVACTETINLQFGSLVAVPEFGFVLNNEMDDFTAHPGEPNAFGLMQSARNAPQPGKSPLSSMSPTIVVRDSKVYLIAGASGGPRIINGTLQSLLNAMLFDMNARDAVEQPRIHHQWLPDILQFEQRWPHDSPIMASMLSRGHAIGRRELVGKVQMIRVTDDGIEAWSDTRKGGRPAGY